MQANWMMKATLLAIVVFASATIALAQASENAGPIRSSAAYSEILLRKTELLADLEALSADYTEANPRIIDLRVELGSLDKSLEKVFGVKPSETDKLTLALGKLIVKKAALESEFSRVSRSYNKDHPESKRARRRVEIFENAIREVLR